MRLSPLTNTATAITVTVTLTHRVGSRRRTDSGSARYPHNRVMPTTATTISGTNSASTVRIRYSRMLGFRVVESTPK